MAFPQAGGDSGRTQVLLHTLCSKVTGQTGDALSHQYELAAKILGRNLQLTREIDEFEIAEKIKKKLAKLGREKDAAYFSELHRKLKSQGLLKERWAVLYLLLQLSKENQKSKFAQPSLFLQGLFDHATSTPIANGGSRAPAGRTTGGARDQNTILQQSSASNLTGSSGFSSIHASESSKSSIAPKSFHPSYAVTPRNQQSRLNQLSNTAERLLNTLDSNQSKDSARSTHSVTSLKTLPAGQGEVTESMLLREVIYVLQGIEGKFIKIEASKEGFKIDSTIGLPSSMCKAVYKLAECGWAYSKIRKYVDSRSSDRAFGLVGQSFCAALQQELTEYYRLIAVLESQLQQEDDQGVVMSGGLTLRRLFLWLSDPLVRLKTMAALVDVCQGKKGGALASVIHSYIQHGDPDIQTLIKQTLTLVAQPIFSTIMRWVYDGDLEDVYHEFFVASDPTVRNDRLWHDKYSLRKSMVPSFITTEQAHKILLTGKSINFLRQVCQDRTTMRHRSIIKAAETHLVESIFNQQMDGTFEKMIDVVYKETSAYLLEVMHSKYKFMDHLKALRRYLLLGQGDFISHLMDLLEEDLAKPANSLFLHSLTGILETAIRATNAQYDDTDILNRVDVRILEMSPGESGWDVFSLDYHVDGPIKTISTPDSIIRYLRIFNFLWRAKRIEYILCSIWKGMLANNRFLRPMPELSPVLHKCHLICEEMVHFIQQVQYYFNFEVLECSWDQLLQQVREAEDLDDVIKAHEAFLDTITARALLDPQSSHILDKLRAIFDLIIQFHSVQEKLFQASLSELDFRKDFNDTKQIKSQKGEWATTEEREQQEEKRRVKFRQTVIPSTRTELLVLHNNYQIMVEQFLLMLTEHSDISLRFLSFRLDFNEYYRDKEPRLRSPTAYHKVKKRIT